MERQGATFGKINEVTGINVIEHTIEIARITVRLLRLKFHLGRLVTGQKLGTGMPAQHGHMNTIALIR